MALIQSFTRNRFGQDVEGAYCRIEGYWGSKTSLSLDVGLYVSKNAAVRNEDGTNQYQPFDIVRINLELADIREIVENPLAYGYKRIKEEFWPDAKDD